MGKGANSISWLIYFSMLLFLGLLAVYLGYYYPDQAMDFNSLYQSLSAYNQSLSPYQSSYYVHANLTVYGNNLNPPIFLLLFGFLAKLNFSSAYIVWSVISSLSLICGLHICFKLNHVSNAKYVVIFICLSFPVLANIVLGQMGNIIFFLLISGYYFYINKYENSSAVVWGALIALKLFPGLILIYLLNQRSFQLVFKVIMVVIGISLLPLLSNLNLYDQYYQSLQHITWYSHSWNMSLIGMIYKLGLTRTSSAEWFNILALLGYMLNACLLILYVYLLTRYKQGKAQQFALTSIFMCLLSPLCWVYYLPILIFPALLLCAKKSEQNYLYYGLSLLLMMPVLNCFIARECMAWLTIMTLGSMPFWAMLIMIRGLYGKHEKI